jgi:hypothetical protein
LSNAYSTENFEFVNCSLIIFCQLSH